MGTPAKSETLENRIGSRWLNRIGIIAVLVGVSYFLKYAFENDWIGPSVQVILGIVAGIVVAAWSERFRRRGFAGFSYSLKAVGAGALYLSLWASFALYGLVPAAVAFCGMVVVTAAMAAVAVWESAEVLAGLALVGGFLTPVLVSTGENQEAALLSYLLLLDAAALLLEHYRSWPRIIFGSFVGTELIFVFWYVKFYSSDQFAVTAGFLSAFFALFAAAPLVADLLRQSSGRTPLRTAVVLPVLNGFAYFSVIYVMLWAQGIAGRRELVSVRAAQYLLAIAALYGGLGAALDRRASDAPPQPGARMDKDARWLLPLVHFGMAVACLTAAIALWLHGHWIAFSWLVEAAALFYAGAKAARAAVKWLGVMVAVLAIFNLLIGSIGWRTDTLLLNERFGLYLLAIGVIAAMIWWQQQAVSGVDAHNPIHRQALVVAVIAINLLALCALNLEVGDYFHRELQSLTRALSTHAARGLCAAGALAGHCARLLLLRRVDGLRCAAHVGGLLEAGGIPALAGNRADRSHHPEGLHLRRFGPATRLPDSSLHDSRGDSAGDLIRLSEGLAGAAEERGGVNRRAVAAVANLYG